MKYLLFISLFIAIIQLGSCSKSVESSKAENTISGKWNLIRYVSETKQAGYVLKDSGNYPSGSYLQLEPDGKCFLKERSIYQTTWKLLNDNKTLFIQPTIDVDAPDQGFEIKSHINNSLVLYSKEIVGSDYDITTIYLNR